MRHDDSVGHKKMKKRVGFWVVGCVFLAATVSAAVRFEPTWPSVIMLGIGSMMTLLLLAPEKAREAARLFGSMVRAFKGTDTKEISPPDDDGI